MIAFFKLERRLFRIRASFPPLGCTLFVLLPGASCGLFYKFSNFRLRRWLVSTLGGATDHNFHAWHVCLGCLVCIQGAGSKLAEECAADILTMLAVFYIWRVSGMNRWSGNRGTIVQIQGRRLLHRPINHWQSLLPYYPQWDPFLSSVISPFSFSIPFISSPQLCF